MLQTATVGDADFYATGVQEVAATLQGDLVAMVRVAGEFMVSRP